MSGRKKDKKTVATGGPVNDALNRAKKFAREHGGASVFVIVMNDTHKYAEVNLGGPAPLTRMLGQLAMEQHRMTAQACQLEDLQEEGA